MLKLLIPSSEGHFDVDDLRFAVCAREWVNAAMLLVQAALVRALGSTWGGCTIASLDVDKWSIHPGLPVMKQTASM